MELILFYAALLITFLSSLILRIIYSVYKRKYVESELTGYEAAKKILERNNLDDIQVTQINGELTDYYDNRNSLIALSEDIYDSPSIASVSVAAHECGHALQYDDGYLPIKIRNTIVPIVNIGSTIGYYAIFISLFASLSKLFTIGIILISLGIVFQLITLPVEFNASKRGKKELIKLGIITEEEKIGADIMLLAAAFTYVAGLISSVLQVLRLILMFSRKDD